MGLPGLLKRRLLRGGLTRQLVPTAALVALLGGCGTIRRDLPVMLYVAISVQDETDLSTENAALLRQRFNHLVQDFRRVHPNVLVQVALYQETNLRKHLQVRNQAGLGPDLILTGADSAHTLLRAGLVDAIPEDTELRGNSDPELLTRMRSRDGRLAGQPLILFPQLACFDRRQVEAPPSSLTGLLQTSATGVPVGLPMVLRQLLWTAGGFGAIPGLATAEQGLQPSPLDKARIRNWLTWLQQASDQQRVTFMPNQTALRNSLSQGTLAWVSCNSAELDLLRSKLGAHLGVTALPNGTDHPASPVNRLRVLALGRNSSALQRQMSLKLIRFSASPLVQRSLTLDSLTFLPTNPHVSVPVQSSGVLAAMVQSRQQAHKVDHLLADIHQEDPRLTKLDSDVIVPVLFGLVDPERATDRLIGILRRQP